MSFQTHCSGALNEEGEIALLNPGFLMDLRVCTMFYYSKCEHWTSLREIFHILDDSPLTSEIHKYIRINNIYSEIKMSPLTVLELHLGTTTTTLEHFFVGLENSFGSWQEYSRKLDNSQEQFFAQYICIWVESGVTFVCFFHSLSKKGVEKRNP